MERIYHHKTAIAIALLIFINSNLFAANWPTATQSLQGFEVITQGSNITIQIQSIGSSLAYSDENLKNILTLGYDHTNKTFLSSSQLIEVKVDIERWNEANGVLLTLSDQILSITIDPISGSAVFKDKDVFVFTDSYKFKVTVTEIKVNGSTETYLPEYCYIDLDMNLDRYIDFTPAGNNILALNSPQFKNLNGDAITNDAIELTWNAVDGADEYELEWTFVNNYNYNSPSLAFTPRSANTLDVDFRKNSTRVTAYKVGNNCSYLLNNIFDRGYIIYRVRGIGRELSAPHKNIYGKWSLPDQCNVGATLSSSANSVIYNQNPHEPDKNWQFSASYAEQGKHKEVINYYDGTTRGRQTVTQNNTDKNVIVGQTIFDFQGRPSVNVLPVPVELPTGAGQKPALKFYPSFNQNAGQDAYTKLDFDVDALGNNCGSNADPMLDYSGASSYYSSNNPDIGNKSENRLLPNADGYPFSVIEYTPDLTGRIRRQGGVGPNFQLNSSHESKFYYVSPNQLELDRLFGSEVGDCSQYQKNLSIDPNGQISIQYINKAGKTIATALTGNAPSIGASGPEFLESINSPGTNDEVTVDLFNKNSLGQSSLNSIDVTNESIVFNQFISVDNAGTYVFDYTIETDNFTDPCLIQDICFDCVYNLEIHLVDECGIDIASTSTPDGIVSMIGHFTGSQSEPVFSIICDDMQGAFSPTGISLNLNVGSYQLIKKLSINFEARDFYITQYLDSAINTCFSTLDEIYQEQLNNMDITGCDVTCEECVEALGTRDDFISSGKGTGEEYDMLVEECMEPCTAASECDVVYQMMLNDMGKGGQYGEYIDPQTSNISPSIFPVSIFNINNKLPENIATSNTGNWKFPKLIINGVTFNEYRDDNNERTKIFLDVSNPSFPVPSVSSVTNVWLDAATGQYFTYPEFLHNVSDFLSFWENGWERSLVTYHPEYCYYKACLETQIVQPGENRSIIEFSNLMLSTNTFQQAQNHLIDAGTGEFKFMVTSNTIYDPFTIPNSATQNSTIIPINFNINDKMVDMINNYQSNNSGGFYSMYQIAAISVNCNTSFSSTLPASTCTSFSHVPANRKDDYWLVLRSIFLGERSKLLWKRANEFAFNCAGYNSCIGSDNNYHNQMINQFGYTMNVSGSLVNLPYYNPKMPCSIGNAQYYFNKVKRFIDPTDYSTVDPEQTAYQLYLQTGQCPVTFDLQSFLNKIASEGNLDGSISDISTYGEFTLNLYQALLGGVVPTSTVVFSSAGIPSGNTISITFNSSQTASATITIDKSVSSSLFSTWDDIDGISNLKFNSMNGNLFNFTAVAYKINGAGFEYGNITGSTSINIRDCSFPPTCTANDLAKDIQMLLTIVASSQSNGIETTPISQIPISSNLHTLITARIRALFGASASQVFNWTYDPGLNTIDLRPMGSATKALNIRFISSNSVPFTLNDLNDIKLFKNITSNYQNYFNIEAYNSSALSGTLPTATLSGEVTIIDLNPPNSRIPVSMGSCEMAAPLQCNENGHLVKENLHEVLNDVLTIASLNYTAVNFYASPSLSNLTSSYLSPLTNTPNVSSYYQPAVIPSALPYPEIITIRVGGCETKIQHEVGLSSPLLYLNDLVSIGELTATGPTDAQGNFHEFEAIGTFVVNGVSYQEPILGSSPCLPLKNCKDCETTIISSSAPTTPQAMAARDSADLASGILINNIYLSEYNNYVELVDSINSRFGWTPDSSSFVPYEEFEDFHRKSHSYSLDAYKDYADNFESLIDNPFLLGSIDTFSTMYGNLDNCTLQFERYLNSISEFNANSDSAHQITPIDQVDFNLYLLCDSVNSYAQYILEGGFIPDSLPQNIITYFSASLLNPSDSCEYYYEQYITAFDYFLANKDSSQCLMHGNYPFYTQDVFIANNLCCSQSGRNLLNDYIQSFYTVNCPNDLPVLDSCNSTILRYSLEECQQNYDLYLTMISDYNNSTYASTHSHFLYDPYPNFQSFMNDNRCECISGYMNYLLNYLKDPVNPALGLPYNINEDPNCNPSIVGNNECATAYDEYVSAIQTYNSYAIQQTQPYCPLFTNIIGQESFTYCHCVDNLIAFVQSVIHGNITNCDTINKYLHLNWWCDDFLQTENPNCDPAILDTIQFPAIEEPDPCIVQAENLAWLSANMIYNNYIQNLTTSISAAYTSHCLNSVVENLTQTYTDKRKHFTLYYYDQSGNLIKTIPPEGVRVKNITSYLDPEAIAINNDRTFNKHTVFTDHYMPTTYEYNSLNQLVRQSLPDHDKIDKSEISLPAGVDNKILVTSIQFSDQNHGNVVGYSPSNGSSPEMGYYLRTTDGGNSWQPQPNIIGADLKRIFMIDNLNGYAAGSNGTLLKTMDGGNSWSMISLYDHGVMSNINDLYFTNTTTGVLVTDAGEIISTSNGFQSISKSTLSPVERINSIEFDGTTYVIGTSTGSGDKGNIYYSTNLTTWMLSDQKKANNLTSLQIQTINDVFASGENGTLLYSDNSGTAWKLIATNIAHTIHDFYFGSNKIYGVALVEAVSGKKSLYKTFNGGENWEPLGDQTFDYTALVPYDEGKVLGYGKNGLIVRILLTQPSFAVEKLILPSALMSSDIISADIAIAVNNTNPDNDSLFIIACSANNLFYTFNGNISNNPNLWREVISFTSPNFQSVACHSPAAKQAEGLIKANGNLFSYFLDNTTSNPMATNQIITASDLIQLGYSHGKFTGFSSGTSKIVEVELTGSLTNIITGISYVPKKFDYFSDPANPSSNMTMLVGNDGAINRQFGGGYSDHSNGIEYLPINDIVKGPGEFMATGRGGKVYTSTNCTNWKMLGYSAVSAQNSIVPLSTSNYLLGGEQGSLTKLTLSGTTVSSSSIATGTIQSINQAAISNNEVLLACSGGQFLHVDDITSNPPIIQICNSPLTNSIAYGVCTIPSTQEFLSASAGSGICKFQGLSGVRINQIHPVKLNDVNFYNTQNGYIVGSKGFIRHTADGGQTWQFVAPTYVSGIGTPQINKVWTYKPDLAFMVGNSFNSAAYFKKISNTTISSVSGTISNVNLTDIAFGKGTTGYFVGDNGRVYSITENTSGFSISDISISPTFNIRTAHVFRNNDVVIAGDGGNIKVKLHQNSSWSSMTNSLPSGTNNIKDISFADDRNGFLVADGGKLFKTSNNQNYASLATASWSKINLYDDFGISSSNEPDLMLSSLAVPRFGHLLIGGLLDNSPDEGYIRKIIDESFIYSTYHWYDKIGRLVLSQNTKQFASTPKKWSYTIYDSQGRISEVGEKKENNGATDPKFTSVFGSTIDNIFYPTVIDDNNFSAWLDFDKNNTRIQVQQTFYDNQDVLPVSNPVSFSQENLRKRVATTSYEEIYDDDDATYDNASHYSYDIHGNVKSLLNENTTTGVTSQQFKRIDYDYDLISGKVNEVKYQTDQPDRFYHRYNYDADNRLTDVYTTRDGIIEDHDARYYYYTHGPLARVELGTNVVQGMDYFYTLQGWMKGINSTLLRATLDPGNDGEMIISGNTNREFARDAFSFSLGYFEGDYTPIDDNIWADVDDRFVADLTGSDVLNNRFDLWNGNISSVATTLTPVYDYSSVTCNSFSPAPRPLANAYKYDQLNRIVNSKSFANIETMNALSTFNTWLHSGNYNGMYQNDFTYDANGNIKTQLRKDQTGVTLDNLTYHYSVSGSDVLQNRLYHVNDQAGAVGTEDLPDQGTFNANTVTMNTHNNYGYDEIGNLVRDSSEQIALITWTASGKMKKLVRKPTSTKPDLEFEYDAMGNRISKIVKPDGTSAENGGTDQPLNWTFTYYVRDASGNIMATYEKTSYGGSSSYLLKEQPLYGSSRLGIDILEREMIGATVPTSSFEHLLGYRLYEGSNHLGNVLTTFSDIKIPRESTTTGITGYYNSDVRSISDYYPFGAAMAGRNMSGESYRFGFNSQEKTDEISGMGNHNTALFWEYDTRLGRRWNIDPVLKHWESPYSTFSNNPVLFIDPNGDDVVNGDRLVANKQKVEMEKATKSLNDFKKNQNIGENTKWKDFKSQGGTKEEWKEYRELRKEARNATHQFNSWDARANVTQGIIDKWELNSPNLFNEVDKQSTDFILTSFNFEASTYRAFGTTTPEYSGSDKSAIAPPSMNVRIAQQVNLSSVDIETGQYSLNHEAGHFLYIVKFTAEYVRYYVESNKKGTYVIGGHGKTDESGKVATKYGNMKDIPSPAPAILPTGN